MRVRSFLVSCFVVSLGCSASGDKDGDNLADRDDGGGIKLGDSGGTGGFGDIDPNNLDPNKDNDGDGYMFADDCNDADPTVNPGAYDVSGDNVDNDCNGTVDDAEQCDDGLPLESTDGMQYAKALGLCRVAKAGATGKEKTWGVVSAKITTTDETKTPFKHQFGIQEKWGNIIKPRGGSRLAVLSSGAARMPGQPGYFKPLNGPSFPAFTNTGNKTVPPPGWPKNTNGCPPPSGDDATKAMDSVVLKMVIRVPTNAKSFTFDFDFYTSEYIQWACTTFNDSYVAILKGKAPLDPKNLGNISFDTEGNPINVNSKFFQVCTPGASAGGKIRYDCPLGRGELAGTGYEGGDVAQHGATSWLQTRASVVPGEEIEIAFMIWNTSDPNLQSAIVLDNWKWLADGTTAPITDRPK